MLVHYLPSMDPTNDRDEAIRWTEAEQRCLSLSDGVVVTGTSTRSELVARGYPHERCVVALPGVDKTLFYPPAGTGALAEPDHGQADHEPLEGGILSGNSRQGSLYGSFVGEGAEEAQIQLLTVSNWTSLKNHAFMLPVLKTLAHLPWRWRIVGDCRISPALCRSFLREAEELELTERIELLGSVSPPRVAALMREADIFLHPSLMESYGMSVAEAMASGCAVVAAANGGTRSLITDGTDGRLCDSGDKECWTEALALLLSSVRQRSRLALSAIRRTDSFPNWRETARAILDGIEGVTVR
jgi:glycosyltransferase involved in cell wall biosynthesis